MDNCSTFPARTYIGKVGTRNYCVSSHDKRQFIKQDTQRQCRKWKPEQKISYRVGPTYKRQWIYFWLTCNSVTLCDTLSICKNIRIYLFICKHARTHARTHTRTRTQIYNVLRSIAVSNIHLCRSRQIPSSNPLFLSLTSLSTPSLNSSSVASVFFVGRPL